MKKNILFFIAIFLMSFYASSQFINYKYDNGWNLGLNTGGTWQEKERFINQGDTIFTKPYTQLSGGFTFGKALYEKEGSLLAFDLRFRYLRGKNYGWLASADSFYVGIPNMDSVYAYRNYRMDLNEFSLEGVLTLNKLREKTGVILYGFGGLGIIDYRVKADYLNDLSGFVEPYDYSSLNPGATDQQTARELKQLSDLDFESEFSDPKINGDQLKFMPSLGLGIGYQLNDWISIGLEHKITYALHNNLDGLGTSPYSSDLKNDKYHYTAIKLGINLFGEGNTNGGVVQHDDYSTQQTVVGNQEVVPSGNKPLINIINPANNNTVVHNSTYHLSAKVYYVSGKQQITFKHNGYVINDFTYDVNTKLLKANLSLFPGNNFIEIAAQNNFGSDNDQREIVYEVTTNLEQPPIVVINSPAASPYKTNNNEIVISAKILHIQMGNQINFKVNGLTHSNFLYSPTTETFTSSILLEEGANQVVITATNNAGTGSDSRTIYFEKISPPIVNITYPATSPITVTNQQHQIKGKVYNVTSKNQISITHNGYNVSNFKYNTTLKEFYFLATLIQGQNIIQVSAKNEAGVDSESAKIIYQIPEQILPPDVIFVNPNSSPHNVSISNITTVAQVLNVNNVNQITVSYNGVSTNNFAFNSLTKKVTINLNLIAGSNTLKISGTNQAGFDAEEIIVNYTIPLQEELPIVTILDPSVNPYSTNLNSKTINGTIQNVNVSNGASATLNNQTINSFTFDPQTEKFVCNVILNEGANVFEVVAYNNSGTASKATSLIYTVLECNKPEVILTSPANSHFNTTNSKGYLEMQIANEDSFIFKINGEPVPSYNYAQGKFSSFLHLEVGVNTYEVIAINECGSTSKKVSIIYEQEIPCNEPLINMIMPREAFLIHTTTEPNYTMSAIVLELTGSNQLNVTQNNKNIPFNFDLSSGEMQSKVVLDLGENVFKLTAINDCGKTSKTVKITLEKPVALPKITLTQPTSFPFQTQNEEVSVSGVITNISDENYIHVYLDGQAINFSFNSTNGNIVIPTTLEFGSNQILVEAENESGSDNEKVELIRVGTPPQIHLTNRSENTTAKNPEIINVNSRIAIIGYVSNYEDVEFEVKENGSVASFTYSESNGSFSGFTYLTVGQLTIIKMQATNQWGTDTQLLYLKNGSSNSGSGGNSNHGNPSNNNSHGNPSSGNLNNNGNNNSGNSTNNNKNGDNSNQETQKQQQINNEFQKNINKANMYYNSKRWTEAKSYYNKALQLKPSDTHTKNRINIISNKLKAINTPKVKKVPSGNTKDTPINDNNKSGQQNKGKAAEHNTTRSNRGKTNVKEGGN